MKLSLNILISVGLGIALGYFVLPPSISGTTDIVIDAGLMILLFFVGIDIGRHQDVIEKIKKIGFKIILIPFAIIFGSLIGGIIGGVILRIPIKYASAVGSGLGWYTLSSILLSNHSTEISTLAFLSNVVREIIALITIPLIAKYIGKYEAIAPAGATAMDTSLPIISSSTDSEISIIAFITGVICTMSVPIILPMILNL